MQVYKSKYTGSEIEQAVTRAINGGSSTIVVDALPATGDSNTDYILKTSSGFVYYKWIDKKWVIISGGSQPYIGTELPEITDGNENTDYYILDNENGCYIHYRFINGEYKKIGNNSEIYVGIEEPTDDNIKIWINPEDSGTLNDNIESIVNRLLDEKIGLLENGKY